MSTATPTRKEEREKARAERRRREEEARIQAERQRRLIYIAGGFVGLIAIVAVAIALSSGGGSSPSATSDNPAAGDTPMLSADYSGIDQKGNTLGSADAPATMMVFADMQCPFCMEFETGAFRQIVKKYVATGKLKVVFQPISILGTDSVVAARAVAAAAAQGKLFEYSSAFYENQGEENSGYVTEAFLTKVARAVPGLDVAKWRQAMSSEESSALLSRAQTASQTARINSTPSFLLGKTGKPLTQFQPSELKASAFYGKLDKLTS